MADSVDQTLPILPPLSATPSGATVAVVYLARSADGSARDFEPFLTSYRAHPAGLPHDLIILRKGLLDRPDARSALAAAMEDIPHRAVDVSDDGFDIQAYLKLAPHLRHDRVCFLNTFSVIKADNWLRFLSAPLDQPDVGMSGATASYESLYSSLNYLSKIVWLTAVRNIPYSPAIAEQFHEILAEHAPNWLNRQRQTWKQDTCRLLARLLGRTRYDTDIEAQYAIHWDAITRPGGPLYAIPDFRPFPNPHLRSNAFMLRRDLLLRFDFRLENTKQAANLFESGPDGLPLRMAREGLSLILVGADGKYYSVEEWPKSRTFRLGDQSNILISDNQVHNFDRMSDRQKALHVHMTWGEYIPGPKMQFHDIKGRFDRGSLDLVSSVVVRPTTAVAD